MVAPSGGGNEEISYTIKITAADAKKALEEIIQSEDDVKTKTENLKNLLIQFSADTGVSIEKASASFKKMDAVFAGTTNSIINNAAKLAKVQLLPQAGPTTAGNMAGPDLQEEAAIAAAATRIKIEGLQAEQAYKQAMAQEDAKDAQLAQQQAAAVARARVDGALAAQVANQKIVDSVRNIVTANTSVETKVSQLKNLIIQMAQDSGKSIDTVTAEIRKMDSAFAGTSKSVLNLASNAAKQQMFPTQEATGFSAALNQIGIVGQAALGISLVGALRSVIDYFKQATDAALEFSQAQVELQIGARATQRMGNDTTIQQYYMEIAAIQKKYPLFSKVAATEAYTNALVLTRGLKLTKEQFQQLIDVSASASIVMGRDFGETATGIAKSLSSGWFEAAQRAGFLISRQSVIAEGLALGIENAKHGYNAMTEYERAISALSRYVKENGSIQQDVSVVMESQAGKVKIARAEWSNLQLAVGQFFTTLATGTGAIDWLTKFFQSWSDAFSSAGWGIAGIKAFIQTISEFLAIIFRKLDFSKSIIGQFKQALSDLRNFNFGDEFNKNLVEQVKKAELVPMMGNVGKDAGAAFGDGLDEGLQSVQDAFQKLLYDITDEQTKLKNKLEDIWLDYQRKLADIINDATRKIAEANRKYQEDIANANIDANNRRSDAERKYRNNEIDAEARFQEQMRQLREKFLFSLEDALRERDARQVLRLIRQYQMDKENATKEAELAYKERQRAFQEELRQIEEQRAERLRLLAQQYADELAQIQADAAQKRLEALKNYEIAKDDAQQASDERIKQQVLDFQRQYGLTQKQAQALVNLLARYFGTGGPVAKIYQNLVQYIMSLVGIAQAGLQSLNGMNTTIPGYGTPPTPLTQQYAKGGTMIATKPTRAIFGEAGAEVATFTPISQLSQHQQNVVKAFSDINVNSNQQGAGGNLELVVTLDPNLKAEIVNESMYNVSAIVREVNRAR